MLYVQTRTYCSCESLGTPAPPGGNISVRSERYPHIPRGKTHHNPQWCWGALVPTCRIYPPLHHLLNPFTFYKEKTNHTLSTYLRLLLVLFHNRYRFETPLHLYPKPQYLNILQVLQNIKECYCNLKLLPIFRSRQIHSFLYSDRLSSSGHLKQISWITPEPTVWRGVPSWTKLRIRKRISRYVENI